MITGRSFDHPVFFNSGNILAVLSKQYMKGERAMKKGLVGLATVMMCAGSLSAATITTIEQLDELAEFSFSAMGDNNGYAAWNYDPAGGNDAKFIGMDRLERWIRNNDAFCIGVGDHAIGTRKYWFKMTEKDPFFHNHYYPAVGDNCNETDYFYGVTADQATWGRGWVQFKALNNFFERNTPIDQIEFRPKGDTPVLSSKSKAKPNVLVQYEDQLCEYYAKRKQGKFTFHMIVLNVPDPGVLTPRSKAFMMDQLNRITAAGKTNYDVVIVVAQKARWVQRAEAKGWISRAERDTLMTVADLILCGDDHIYRRQNEFDADYDGTEALWMNSGQPCPNTGSGQGYLNLHMFDHPPRFTAQYIYVKDNATRKLHVDPVLVGRQQRALPEECVKPVMKIINGPRVRVDWNNFETAE
jgi:hypothetical protein